MWIVRDLHRRKAAGLICYLALSMRTELRKRNARPVFASKAQAVNVTGEGGNCCGEKRTVHEPNRATPLKIDAGRLTGCDMANATGFLSPVSYARMIASGTLLPFKVVNPETA